MTVSKTTIDVALFAGARALAGTAILTIELTQDATANDVLRQIRQRCEPLQPLLPSCRLAVDLQYVPEDHPISADAQLALIPPVSGG